MRGGREGGTSDVHGATTPTTGTKGYNRTSDVDETRTHPGVNPFHEMVGYNVVVVVVVVK